MTPDEADEADERWYDQAAASVVDELLVAKLITEENTNLVRKIVSQDLFIRLVSGCRPPNSN